RRRVYFDAVSREATLGASLLSDEFDVHPLPPGQSPEGPSVLLVDGAAGDRPRPPDVRVVALVDPHASGPWPTDWFTMLPRGVGGAILARAVGNAFTDLDAAGEIRRLGRELSELNLIGIRLGAERNPDTLLELILTKAREITASDAGSLYLIEEGPDSERRLFFALAQNDSVEVPFRAVTLPLTNSSVAGHVALTGKALNLEDAYHPPAGSPFQINRSFDESTGYRTKSMLVVPMRTPPGETIGVLQLINCKPDPAGPLARPEDFDRFVRPFSTRHEGLAESLASQAAVALDNSRLYQSIQRLFEGFVGAAVTAIESRDPTTSGHSFRVAELTVGLAEAVDRAGAGPYAGVRFTGDEMMELRYAALLHDFGKVGVREHVLLKAKKLYPGELDRIRQRAALIKRGVELRFAGRKIDHLVRRGRRGYERRAAALDRELAEYLAELDESLDRIVMANEPTVLPSDVAARIRDLAVKAFEDHLGEPHALLTTDEAGILAIPRGSLTDEEVREIRSHVVHTFQFLARIPWTREFRRIPEIARSHHEKLDGTGYPNAMRGDEIPLQSRMMTIADIFDALTAGDRPYKKAVPVQLALEILEAERRAGRIDASLLEVFVAARVFERTLPRQ
ncbi:MAG: HD domain-containing phosphohydrolase, partial [Candidatus Rokuibacteriota bacterium]